MSNVYHTPDWQKAAVDSYFDSIPTDDVFVGSTAHLDTVTRSHGTYGLFRNPPTANGDDFVSNTHTLLYRDKREDGDYSGSIIEPPTAQVDDDRDAPPPTPYRYPFHSFNRNGRAYPDIALLGTQYIVAVNASFHTVDGTSASTPVAGQIVS